MKKHYNDNYLNNYAIHWIVKFVFNSENESLWFNARQVYSPSSVRFTGSSNNVDFSCLETLSGSSWSIIRFPFGITLFPLYQFICNEWMASTSLMAIQIKLTLSPSADIVWLLIKIILGGPTCDMTIFSYNYRTLTINMNSCIVRYYTAIIIGNNTAINTFIFFCYDAKL